MFSLLYILLDDWLLNEKGAKALVLTRAQYIPICYSVCGSFLFLEIYIDVRLHNHNQYDAE